MKGFWDFYAIIYDVLNSFTPYKTLQKKVVDALQLIPCLTIADCGCGTGNTIVRILERQKWKTKIVGFERSLSMLNRAKRKVKHEKNVEFVAGNFEDTSVFGGKKYDRIVSVNSLYVVNDPHRALQNWFDLLNDGGLVIIVNPFIPKLSLVFGEFFRGIWKNHDGRSLMDFIIRLPLWASLILMNWHIARKARKHRFHFLHPHSLRLLAESTGFIVLSEELVYGDGSVLFVLQKDMGARFRRAHTHEEIAEVQKIRFEIYCEEYKMVPKENYLEKKEIDRFDEFSFHFIFRIDNVIVGCLRLIADSPIGFLMEEKFILPIDLDREKTVEASRNCLLPRYRSSGEFGRGMDYAKILEESCWEWTLENGYRYWCLAINNELIEKRKKRGWGMIFFGEKDEYSYHHTNVIPIIRIS